MDSRAISRGLVALLFIAAGILHFVYPAKYMTIVPPFLPYPRALVLISGAFEILGGIGILLPPFRKAASYGLVLLLLAVFPANIYMAVAHVPSTGWMGNSILQWLRLPLQFALIWWVVRCGVD